MESDLGYLQEPWVSELEKKTLMWGWTAETMWVTVLALLLAHAKTLAGHLTSLVLTLSPERGGYSLMYWVLGQFH